MVKRASRRDFDIKGAERLGNFFYPGVAWCDRSKRGEVSDRRTGTVWSVARLFEWAWSSEVVSYWVIDIGCR